MRNTLPTFTADLHTHTCAGDHAYSTQQEMIKAAKEQGLKVIAITDHGPAVLGSATKYHFQNQVIWPRDWDGILVLRGAEVNILPGGQLDLDDFTLSRLDFVLAGFHYDAYSPGRSKEEYTESLLQAMQNPNIMAIAHPGNPMYPVDYEKFIGMAKEKNIAVELNNSSLASGMRPGSLENCMTIANLGKEAGVFFTINSDAHIAHLVGRCEHAKQLAENTQISQDRIINVSEKQVLEFLAVHDKKI